MGLAVVCHACRRPAPGGVRLQQASASVAVALARSGPPAIPRTPGNRRGLTWPPNHSLRCPSPCHRGRAGKQVRVQEPVLPFSSGSGAEETAARPEPAEVTTAGRARRLLTPARATEYTRGCRRQPAGVALTAASRPVAPRGAPACGGGAMGGARDAGRGQGGRWEEAPLPPSQSPRGSQNDSLLGFGEAAPCAPRWDGRPGDLAPARGRMPGGQLGRGGSGERAARPGTPVPGTPVPGTMSAEPICSALPAVPSHKLADLRFLSRGASGTVSSARHADWRVQVAVKHLHIHTPLLDR